MGFQSQPGFVGIRTQASKGTYADPAAVAPNQGIYVPIRSGAMGTNRDLMIPDAEIGGHRDIQSALLGPVSFAGEYDMYVRTDSAAVFLKHVLGTVAAPTGTAPTGFTHSITPGDTVPWVSIEEKIGNTFDTFRYTDAKCNTFHLEADSTGYLMATAGYIALTQQGGQTPSAAGVQRWDGTGLVAGQNVTVTWGGATLPAKSFSLDITNNIEDDDFRLGSITLGDAIEKRREITMGVTVRPNDAALWRQAVYGAAASVSPVAGPPTANQAVITITSYHDIPGATAGVKATMAFTVPSALLVPFNLDPSGDDAIEHDIEIRAIRPAVATPIMTAVVKNSLATLP